MHWFNTADELAHEDSLRALAKGGFDQVLDAIGNKFGLDHLHVDSVGFVAVTNCDRGVSFPFCFSNVMRNLKFDTELTFMFLVVCPH